MTGLAKRFGERVKALRILHNLTQAEFADAAHLSEEWLRRIESGKASPSFETIEALCDALAIHPADLFITEMTPAISESVANAALHGLDDQEIKWLLAGARIIKKAKRARP